MSDDEGRAGAAGDDVEKTIKYNAVFRLRQTATSPWLFLPVTSYSWGVNGSYRNASYNVNAVLHPTDPTDPYPNVWTTQDVLAWLKKNGFGNNADFLAWVEREEINGVALTGLSELTIREAPGLKTTLGFRLKLMKALEPLIFREASATEQSWQDLSLSSMYTIAADALLANFSHGKISAHSAALTVYWTNSNQFGRRNPAVDKFFELGEPVLQWDIQRPLINGLQLSGSQGNLEQMYVSLQISYEAITTHSCVSMEAKFFGVNVVRGMLGLKPVSEELALKLADERMRCGTSTFVSQKRDQKPWQQKWGAEIHWSPQMHRFFPTEYKAAVRTLLLVRTRRDSVLAPLNRDVMHVLFSVMARGANPTPFFAYPFPFHNKNEIDNNNCLRLSMKATSTVHVSSDWLEVARGNNRCRVYWRNGKPCVAAELPAKEQGSTRFACISDTHGKTVQLTNGSNPYCTLAPSDVLLHAGDFTSVGTPTQVVDFDAFMAGAPTQHRVVIAGNHDIILDKAYYETKWSRFHKKKFDDFDGRKALSHCVYLQDEAHVTPGGWRVWGSPWQPEFCDWAFNLDRGAPLKAKWDQIPQGTDVLMTHGPPHGQLGGRVIRDSLDAGCEELTAALARIKPIVHVFGHIHEGYGVYVSPDGTACINASSVDFSYRGVNTPIVFDLWRVDEHGALEELNI